MEVKISDIVKVTFNNKQSSNLECEVMKITTEVIVLVIVRGSYAHTIRSEFVVKSKGHQFLVHPSQITRVVKRKQNKQYKIY